MSEDFDKEAERERLREKYERDKQKREASERMSELLLQGATMTNRHCPECHSPVFSYEDREFCPTCQREVPEEGGADGDTDEAGGEAADAAANGDAVDEPAAGAPPEEPAESDGRPADAPREDREETRPAVSRDRRPARVQPPAPRADPEAGSERRDRRERREPAETGDLRDAEAALVREIGALARQAEETRDIGRKRDLFAAANEAAETLRTVRRL